MKEQIYELSRTQAEPGSIPLLRLAGRQFAKLLFGWEALVVLDACAGSLVSTCLHKVGLRLTHPTGLFLRINGLRVWLLRLGSREGAVATNRLQFRRRIHRKIASSDFREWRLSASWARRFQKDAGGP